MSRLAGLVLLLATHAHGAVIQRVFGANNTEIAFASGGGGTHMYLAGTGMCVVVHGCNSAILRELCSAPLHRRLPPPRRPTLPPTPPPPSRPLLVTSSEEMSASSLFPALQRGVEPPVSSCLSTSLALPPKLALRILVRAQRSFVWHSYAVYMTFHDLTDVQCVKKYCNRNEIVLSLYSPVLSVNSDSRWNSPCVYVPSSRGCTLVHASNR